MHEKTACQLLVEEVLDKLQTLGKLSSRSMFGGYGICYEKVMFGLVAENKFFLRADKAMEKQFKDKKAEQFVYKNRGIPVVLSYYHIDEAFWCCDEQFIDLVKRSLQSALAEQLVKKNNKSQRLKDLPNLGLSTERLLSKVGITNRDLLMQNGAVNAYLKIKNVCCNASIELLFSLAGAIEGCHVAVLPEQYRQRLLDQLNANKQTWL